MFHWILLKARGIINKKETKPLSSQTLQCLQTNLSQAVRWQRLLAKSCTEVEPGGKTTEFGSSSSWNQFESAQSVLMPALPGWELFPRRVLCPQQGFDGRLPEQSLPGEKSPFAVNVGFIMCVLIDSLQFPKATDQKNAIFSCHYKCGKLKFSVQTTV